MKGAACLIPDIKAFKNVDGNALKLALTRQRHGSTAYSPAMADSFVACKFLG